jgi:hypothetical protein
MTFLRRKLYTFSYNMEHCPSMASQSKVLVINKEHVNQALTQYLRSLSFIPKDYEVISFKKSPEGLEVKVDAGE